MNTAYCHTWGSFSETRFHLVGKNACESFKKKFDGILYFFLYNFQMRTFTASGNE